MKWFVIAVALAACGGKSRPSPPPAGSRIGAALATTMAAIPEVAQPWRCGASDAPGLVNETLTGAKHKWQLGAHAISTVGNGVLEIGVVADAGGAAAPTIAALDRIRTAFGTPDLVLVLGGMGTTAAELEATLGTLAGGALVVALPGDLEDAGALRATVGKLRAAGKLIVDGRLVRRIDLPGATIATISGSSRAQRLVAKAEGCGYAAPELAHAFDDLALVAGLRILAATEAPRGSAGGDPVGDRALLAPADKPIDLVLHAPATPRATTAKSGARDGLGVALTPGTSDATSRLPEPSAPSAGVLTLSGSTWRWRPIEAPR